MPPSSGLRSPSSPGASDASGHALAERSTRWADLRVRAASAAVMAPVALLCAWVGGWLFGLLLLAGFAGVCFEWAAMCRRRAGPLVLGVFYAALALSALWLVRDGFGFRGVLFLLMVVWCSDIGAFAAGRLLGGPRLAPRVSPGKTWSGAAGGLLAAMVAGCVVAGFRPGVAGLAGALGVASQLGDLGESAVKRHYGVKDSGRLIPGHGGLLDRLDGLMAAAVVCGLVMALVHP